MKRWMGLGDGFYEATTNLNLESQDSSSLFVLVPSCEMFECESCGRLLDGNISIETS